jgi:hypothetical protein
MKKMCYAGIEISSETGMMGCSPRYCLAGVQSVALQIQGIPGYWVTPPRRRSSINDSRRSPPGCQNLPGAGRDQTGQQRSEVHQLVSTDEVAGHELPVVYG